MFLKLTFLEGKRCKSFFQINPPLKIHVFSSRAIVAKVEILQQLRQMGMLSLMLGLYGKRVIREKL